MISKSLEVTAIPNDYEAEQGVLGAIIYENQKYTLVRSKLLPEMFYTPGHQHIFRAMMELYEKKSPIDELLLGDQLKSLNQLEEVGGYGYLSVLQECDPAGNIEHYASIIEEKHLLRKLIIIGSDLSRKCRDPEGESNVLIAESLKLIESTTTRSTSFHSLKDLLCDVFEKAEKAKENKQDEFIGYPTGFYDYDRLTSGLQKTNLIIIAGRPGMGKTALALCMGTNAAKLNKLHVLVFTHEMSKEEVTLRILCAEAKVEAHRIRRGIADQDEWDRLAMATDVLSGLEISVDDSENLPIEELTARALAENYRNPVDLVIIDYLGLLRSLQRTQNRTELIGVISRGCKSLAKKLDCNVILLSQLNRALEQRKDKRPIMSDLRESGDIEQDADIIIFVYRDEYYNMDTAEPGIAELIIAKHRNGSPGFVKLNFEGRFTRFSNLNEAQRQF